MKILIIASVSWLIAQLHKVIYYYYLNKRIKWSLFLASGGMPSSHSAFITSISYQIGLLEGFNTSLFALSAAIAFIVIYDSFNVRRSVGIQGKTINIMLDYYTDVKNTDDIKKLKEVMGHTPLQVTIGVLLGIIVVTIANFLNLV